jgi:hypothetical protein
VWSAAVRAEQAERLQLPERGPRVAGAGGVEDGADGGDQVVAHARSPPRATRPRPSSIQRIVPGAPRSAATTASSSPRRIAVARAAIAPP